MFKGLRYNYAALCLCAIACCAWSYVVDLEYFRMMYFSWDLALYANLMWNLCHGYISTSLFGGPFFVDHFNAIAFLLVPFYFFSQSALTILYFKLFAFFTGAYVLYLLAAKRMGGLWSLAFMLAYIFYPTNVGMLFFEFNFESLALPMILLLFYYFEEKNFVGFIVCCSLLAIVKENMPLVVFMFGVYGLIARKNDRLRWGLYPLLLGGGMFFGEVFVFIPWFRHGLGAANAHLSLYARFGNNPAEIIHTIIFNEPKVFKALFNGHNFAFLLKLFGPLLIVIFWAPRAIFLATPFFLQDLLSKSPGQQDINSFYSSTLTVFIFVAAIDSVERARSSKFKTILLGVMTAGLLIFDLWYAPQWWHKVSPFEEKQAVSQYCVSQIPSDAGVYSSYKFLYLVSQRKDLYVLSFKHKEFLPQKEMVPDTVDRMIVDFSNRVDNKDVVRQMLLQGQWTVQAAADEIVLLRKNKARGQMLIKRGKLSFAAKTLRSGLMVGDALMMERVEVPKSLKAGQRIMRVVFYWKVLKEDKNENLPPIVVNIFKGPQRVYSKNRSAFYSLPLEGGAYYKEAFYYLIPRLSPGDYLVEIYPLPSDGSPSHQSALSSLRVR